MFIFSTFVVGTSFCCGAVWRTNSLYGASATADVCRELKGLEALCPGGWWTETEAGLPLPGDVRWVFPAPQQTGPAALTPWWGDSGPGGSYFDVDLPLCTLDPCAALASTHLAKAINLSPFQFNYKSVDINLFERAGCVASCGYSAYTPTLSTVNLQCSLDQYYYHT